MLRAQRCPLLGGCFLVLCFNIATCLVSERVHSRAAIPFEVVLASVMLVRRGFEIEYLNTFLRVSQGGPRWWRDGMGWEEFGHSFPRSSLLDEVIHWKHAMVILTFEMLAGCHGIK